LNSTCSKGERGAHQETRISFGFSRFRLPDCVRRSAGGGRRESLGALAGPKITNKCPIKTDR